MCSSSLDINLNSGFCVTFTYFVVYSSIDQNNMNRYCGYYIDVRKWKMT